MNVSLKEEYKGQLGLQYDQFTGKWNYILTQVAYPKYEPEIIHIEDGDVITIRSPQDGSILMHRVVEFDYDSHKSMNLESGVVHQYISQQPVNGILRNIEPNYWFNLFAQGYYADLTKEV